MLCKLTLVSWVSRLILLDLQIGLTNTLSEWNSCVCCELNVDLFPLPSAGSSISLYYNHHRSDVNSTLTLMNAMEPIEVVKRLLEGEA